MNADRRRLVLNLSALVDAARDLAYQIANEEREAFDNLPESIQGDTKGYEMEQIANRADEILETIENLQYEVSELCSESGTDTMPWKACAKAGRELREMFANQ